MNSTFPVFYLSDAGGGQVERTCKVPNGKGLLIPLMTVEVSDKEVPNVPIEDLHKIAKKNQDSVTSLYLKINDKEYLFEDLEKNIEHILVILKYIFLRMQFLEPLKAVLKL